MDKASRDNNLSGTRKEQVKEPGFPGNQEKSEGTVSNTEIKNAQAAGIGALGRSDENQIEKLIDSEPEKDDDVY
jgi:hypothetical protein